VAGSASQSPFDAGEDGSGAHGDDDGIRVRLEFTVNYQVFGTYVNGVYHPAGACNGRRLFRRSIGGGGCPPLFLYYMANGDSWVVGLKPGDSQVYAVCGPAEDNALAQTWQVWDGSKWIENPSTAAVVLFRCDQQTARWEDEIEAEERATRARKAREAICQKLYKYAKRGGLNPKMERGGICQDLTVLITTDLIPGRPENVLRKMALDVKVIDEGDGFRYGVSSNAPVTPLGAADACRKWLKAHHNTRDRCWDEMGWQYEPVVLTVQGGFQLEAEAVIALIAATIGKKERQAVEPIRGELRRAVANCLA